jgi:hypothetical protein
MVEANRAAAAAVGCGVLGRVRLDGRRRRVAAWRKAGWLTNDFVHPTAAGDARLGAALTRGLLDAYAAFRAR